MKLNTAIALGAITIAVLLTPIVLRIISSVETNNRVSETCIKTDLVVISNTGRIASVYDCSSKKN